MSAAGDTDRDRYARLTTLFHQAIETTGEAREAFLGAVDRAEPALAHELRALVAAHDRAQDFIERPPLESASIAVPREPIGPYRPLGVIGAGGMGIVYLAEDTRLGRTVALKAVRSEFAGDEARIARLRREARAAAAIAHPNVATVYALEEIDGHAYVASEFVAGDTLRDELRNGSIAPARVLDLVLAIARALAAAHEHGVVHRDLKPENVVTTPKGDVKVLDFGLAQFTDPSPSDTVLTEDGAVLGTPGYMAPEQIRGEPVDGRADLFALGVIIHELLTARHPFAGATPAVTIARVLEAPAPTLTVQMPDGVRDDPAVAALQVIAARCLEKHPSRRPQHAAEVVAWLEAARHRHTPAIAEMFNHRTSIPANGAAAWWWQFHQAATTLAYLLLLIPLWRVRDMTPGASGMTFFVTGLVAVVVSGMLRLHLWFALRQYPGEWATDHRLARLLVRAGDTIFALCLAARGLTAIRVDDPSAVLLIAAAASVAVSFIIIEPATARAMERGTSAS